MSEDADLNEIMEWFIKKYGGRRLSFSRACEIHADKLGKEPWDLTDLERQIAMLNHAIRVGTHPEKLDKDGDGD